MIDIFLLMLSVAAHAAPGADATAPGAATATATAQSAAADSASPGQGAQTAGAPPPPVFLAPKEPAAAAPPAFLSPQQDGAAALRAEPQIPTGKFTVAAEVKPILTMTKGNWIAVRDFNGQDLLYVTHLWSWRCGLLQIRLGVNGAAPEIWPLPPCHADSASPNAILDSDGPPYRAYPAGSVREVEVHVTFDDLSTDSARFDRAGVQIP